MDESIQWIRSWLEARGIVLADDEVTELAPVIASLKQAAALLSDSLCESPPHCGFRGEAP